MGAGTEGEARERMRSMLTEQVADALAVIPPQAASAGALVTADADAAARAVAVVQRSAEDALDALRRLLPVLPETGGSPYAPQPGLADVHLEAARRRDDANVDFALARDLGHVPAGVQLVVHCALVAGLELAERSGGGASVALRRRPGAVVLTVCLAEPVPATAAEEALRGVERRAALYGGAVRWSDDRLTLTVPLGEAA